MPPEARCLLSSLHPGRPRAEEWDPRGPKPASRLPGQPRPLRRLRPPRRLRPHEGGGATAAPGTCRPASPAATRGRAGSARGSCTAHAPPGGAAHLPLPSMRGGRRPTGPRTCGVRRDSKMEGGVPLRGRRWRGRNAMRKYGVFFFISVARRCLGNLCSGMGGSDVQTQRCGGRSPALRLPC